MSNYKNELITYFGKQKKCVTFRSNKIGGPSNAPVWYSWIEVNRQKVIDHQFPGSKVDSEQELAKIYLGQIKQEITPNKQHSYTSSNSSQHGSYKSGDCRKDSGDQEDDDYQIEDNTAILNQLRKEEQITQLLNLVEKLQMRVAALEKNQTSVSEYLKTNAQNLIYMSNRIRTLEEKLAK